MLTTVGAATALAAIFWFWAPVLELPNNIDTFTAALQQISRVNSWSRPRECRSLSHFSNAGKQTKPICFFSKGRSGMGGKAHIEGCIIVSRGNTGLLFWAKRHPASRMPVGQRSMPQ